MTQIIWFICKDAAPLSESGSFFRTLKQAQYFRQKGYDVKIICSDWVHNTEICHKTNGLWKTETHDNVAYVFLKSMYYGKSNTRRLISYILFAKDVVKLLNFLKKPQVIIHTSRIPFDYQIFKFARKCKAKYIMDVSDLWPWELEHQGVLSKNNPLLILFYRIERNLYAKADEVVFSFQGGPDYIRDRKWDKQDHDGPIDLNRVHYVNTGLDREEFNDYLKRFRIDDVELLDKDTFKVVYLGSIRRANNVTQLLSAAKCLRDNIKIKFLIYGDGPDRDALEKRVVDEGLVNVVFKDKWIRPQYVPFVLTQASLNILNYMKGWAPYGGSMNKMFMAIASGKPVLCNAGMGYSPIREYEIGIDQEFENSQDYANAILHFFNMSNLEYESMCDRCKRASLDFDAAKLNEKFAKYCKL